MPTHIPDNRSIVSISGADAAHFLQNLVTCDIDPVADDEARAGALLTPQGKIMFDFLLARDGTDGFLIDIRNDMATDFVRRLTMYKLRANVDISVLSDMVIAISWSDISDSVKARTVRDSRFGDQVAVLRHYGDAPAGFEDDAAGWAALRIARGIAECGSDYQPGDAFPHDVALDQHHGVGFKKGCYVGQEVVSRMQHRGTARRRPVVLTAETALGETGETITAGGRAIGTLGTVSGNSGLAIVRLDRARDAIDAGTEIAAGEVPVAVSLPDGAGYGWPAADKAGD
ncbi:YgfZ/GcvT domain-containing protein [Oricola sp.]|uniref:CAF17-like 4Fe-4S cluster assembly/insertion protein YgfZ n=1 Tax=Oricola sp. TaxID=1979950 RepID=UPI003BA9374C